MLEEAWLATVYGVLKSWTHLVTKTFTYEKILGY